MRRIDRFLDSLHGFAAGAFIGLCLVAQLALFLQIGDPQACAMIALFCAFEASVYAGVDAP